MTPQRLELIRHGLLLLVAVVCVYTDLAKGRLYNVATLGGLAAGLVIALLLDAGAPGFPRLIAAALAAAIGGGTLFVLYLSRAMGGGDVKMMAAVGALGGGWRFIALTLVYTALVGAAIAIGALIWRGRLREGLRGSLRAMTTFRRPAPVGGAPAPQTIPYGVAIGLAVVWAWIETYLFR